MRRPGLAFLAILAAWPTAIAAQSHARKKLYERGGIAKKVWGPKDKVSRLVSLKIVTSKSGGRLIDQLGICDITTPSVYCQSFDIEVGERVFNLEDRVPGLAWYKHVLKIFPEGGELRINFGRPGHEDQVSITVSRLYRLRVEQALDEGDPLTLGSRRFLSLPQGLGGSALLFFRSDSDPKNQYDWGPELMAELKSTSALAPLGRVDGDYYYLKYDTDRGWHPVVGAEQAD
jgi:hypothetical protein